MKPQEATTKRVVRTYSRQTKRSLHDEEPPTKRRRIASAEIEVSIDASIRPRPKKNLKDYFARRSGSALPSSSPDASIAIFSDEPQHSSPPTSPASQPSSPPPARIRRPTFSIFKRRAGSKQTAACPLSERNPNMIASTPNAAVKQKRLVQMQLDLAADDSRSCKTCGMDYVPSHAEDAALHRKFHAMNVGGVDIPKSLSEKLRQHEVWTGENRSYIAAVSRRDTHGLRSKAKEVLHVVNLELGAIPIIDEILWSQQRHKAVLDGACVRTEDPSTKVYDRFRMYLYIQGGKCTGACLAERIQEAFSVLEQDAVPDPDSRESRDVHSSSIAVGRRSRPAMVGISRIWTSNVHRNKGIATRLLDAAKDSFLYGMTVDKAQVAFSQPTESGGRLATKWFGKSAGWLVYME